MWFRIPVLVLAVGASLAQAAEEPKPAIRSAACRNQCSLGAELTVTIDSLSSLESAAHGREVLLFLDGTPVKGLSQHHDATDPNALVFDLEQNPQNRAVWARVLGRPFAREPRVSVSVGTEDLSAVTTADLQVCFPLLSSPRKAAALLAAVIALWVALYWAGARTPMLRDRTTDGAKAPYSLGRAQMAWWSIHVCTAFLLIWASTNSIDSITPQMLALMGISASTAFGAALIDSNKEAELAAAQGKSAGAQEAAAVGATDPALRAQAAQAKQDVETAKRGVPSGPSHTLITDLLSDANGYSLHRVQIAVWTLVVTVVFWASVWHELQMPVLGDTLLGLMGISSGTYLGFKLPERQS